MKNLKISSGIMNILDHIDTVVMDSLAGTISAPSDFTQHFDSSIGKVPQSVYPSEEVQKQLEKYLFEGYF